MKQDILIVLPQQDNPELLSTELAHNGISAAWVVDIQHAVQSLKQYSNAFLLLDLTLEGSFPFLTDIVTAYYDPPPYLLVADMFPDSAARADVLNLGADACLYKPIAVEEVLALINAVFRRSKRLERGQPVLLAPCIEYKDLTIDPLRRHVKMGTQPIKLTRKEFNILYMLANNAGAVYTKQQIYEQVWNSDYAFASTNVSDHISSLRQKLGLNARDNCYIQTVFGVGYRFEPIE